MNAAQIKTALDAILARAQLPVTPEEYARLLRLYPSFQAQCASLRTVDLRAREPAVIYPARSARL